MSVDIDKISSNTKNIIGLVFLIGEAAWLVFSIQANEKEIKLIEKRCQKRYARVTKNINDHEERLRTIEAFMYQTKGNNVCK